MVETGRKALIDALEASFAAMGMDLYSGAQRLKIWMEERLRYVEASQSRESLEAFLAGCSDVEEARLTQMAQLVLLAPTIIESAVQTGFKQIAAEIPNTPGRPAVLTPAQKGSVVDAVSALHKAGVSLGDAQAQAALRFKVSRRSVQTVWRARKELIEQPFQSMHDLWQFIGRS